MRRSTALFTFALAVGVAFHAPGAGANEARKITECGPIGEPGSYVLTREIGAAGDCLVFSSNFVTIDLAGFTIRGDGTGTGIRMLTDPSNPTPQGFAVRNGTISGFGFGIFLGATASIVEGLQVVNNTNDGMLVAGIVRGNVVQDNGGRGMVVFGTVSGNIARDNGGDGMIIGGGSIASGNAALNNKGRGILISAPVTVSGNIATGNGGIGIDVRCPSNVIGNTATDNVGGNLVLAGEGCTNIDNLAP